MRQLLPGQDPRKVLGRHRERGRVTRRYTVEDVARAAGCSLATVYRARVDLDDLLEVCRFVADRAGL